MTDFLIKVEADLSSLDKQLDAFFKEKSYNVKVKADAVGNGALNVKGKGTNLASSISASDKAMAKANSQIVNFASRLKVLHTQGALATEDFEKFGKQLSDIKVSLNNGKDISKFSSEMQTLKNNVSEASAVTRSHSQDLSAILPKYLKWYGLATLVSLAVNAIKAMISEVLKLDKAMTELNKVTDVTQERLEAVKKQSFVIAEQVGRTGEEVLKATTEFARMGYTLEESLQLSKVAVMMTNVADGISDTGEAAEKIISILKGVGASSDYAMSLLDRLNNVSNKNAISFDKLADMLQDSAATMNILGNNLDETIALLTAGFEVLQDEKVSNGLQTIGLRIAGLNEDLEEEAGLANDVSRALEKYAGISVWDKETGALKNTYTILSEVAEKWDEIGQKAGYQESLLNILAGKRQANVAGAIIQNFEAIDDVLKDLTESAGSAKKENDAYLDSIEGRINTIKNLFQKIADDLISSDLVKSLISILTAVTRIISPLAKVVGLVLRLSGLEQAINGVASALEIVAEVVEGISLVVEKIVTWLEKLPIIGDLIRGASYVFSGQWLTNIVTESKTLDEVYKDIAETYTKVSKQVSNYEDSLSKLINRMKQLILVENEYDEQTSFSERINLLKKENEQSQKQKELQEKILAVEKARFDLEMARNKKIRVFRAGKGFVYQSDESEIQKAQKSLANAQDTLAQYKYELALERAEEFIEAFSNLAEQDKSIFLSGWETLFDSYGDLLETEFSSFLTQAQEFVDKFQETFSELDEVEYLSKSAYKTKIAELELEREQYEEGTAQYEDLSKRIAMLQNRYLSKYDSNYKDAGLSLENIETASKSAIDDFLDNSKIVKPVVNAIGDISIPGVDLDEKGNMKFDGGELAKDLLIPGYALAKALGWKWFAKGTNYAPGGLSLVGEQGPELVNLPTGSRVYTASETRSMLSGLKSNGGVGTSLVFNGDLSFPNVRNEGDAEGFINGLLQIGNNSKPQFI